MKIVEGNLLEYMEENKEKSMYVVGYWAIPYTPFIKSQFLKKNSFANRAYTILRAKKPHAEVNEVRYTPLDSIDEVNYVFHIPLTRLREDPIRPKWAHQKLVKKPKWKAMINLPLLTMQMKRLYSLAGGRKVMMPYPEEYTTAERSMDVIECLDKVGMKNLEIWTIRPLPHLRQHQSVQKVAKRRCSQPSEASSSLPTAALQLSDALRWLGAQDQVDSAQTLTHAHLTRLRAQLLQSDTSSLLEPRPSQPISVPSEQLRPWVDPPF